MAIRTFKLQGKARWAKILGAPVPGYQNGPAEWTLDLVLDKEGLKNYKATGADPFYVKKDKKTNDDVLKFVRKAVKRDGSQAKPIRVLGPDGKTDWDQNVLIGNESDIVVQFTINEVPSQGKTRKKPSLLAVQVWKLSEYTRGSDFDANPDSSNILDQGEDW